ncbi:MAG: BatD family protein [Desulfobacteraceae bacterium]
MKRALWQITLFCVLMVWGVAQAQVSVRLDLDRDQAYYGKGISEAVKLVVSVSGTKSCDDAPQIKGLEPFQVSGGGSSSRVEIVNGQYSATIQYSYFVRPAETGRFVIGPAEVKVDGKVYESNTQTLQVNKGAESPKAPAKAVFLTAELSTTQAFVEQQVLYTLKLYLRERVSDLSLTLPETDHLTFRELGKPTEYRRTFEGRQYGVVEIRYALTPATKGTFDIAPSRIDLTVYDASQQRSRGLFNDPFFDDPFFRRGRPRVLRSEALRLKVRELPQKGRPPDFSGLVGMLHMEASLTPAHIRLGESATLTVKLTGTGNVNRMPDLRLPEITDIKVYADEPSFTMKPQKTGLRGVKEMKWALVPEREGNYQIPALRGSFFDAAKAQYQTVHTPRYTLEVLSPKGGKTGKGRAAQAKNGPMPKGQDKEARGPGKQEIKELGQDILPIHTSMRNMGKTYLAERSVSLLLWAVLLIPFVAYVTVLTGLRLRKRSVRSLPAVKAKKAAHNFLKTYAKAQHDPQVRMAAFRDYINDRFGHSLAAITPEEAACILAEKGVRPEEALALKTAFQKIEDAIYSGQGTEAILREDPIPDLIQRIEKELS